MAADGSIIIDTDIDNRKAQQELNRLNRKIQTLNDQIYVKQKQKIPLVEQAQQLGAELDAAKAKLNEMQTGGRFYTSAHIQEQADTVNQLQKEWDAVNNKIDQMDAGIQKSTIQLDLAKEQAGAIQQQMAAAGPSSERMAKAMERMQKSANRFSLRLREVVRSALVFTVISQGLASLRNWLGRVIQTNSEATAAIARLKGALLTLAQPLLNVVIPAFVTFVNILTKIITVIAQLVSMLFGTTIEQSAAAAEGLNEQADALEGVGSAAKSAHKDLAAFDQINKLTGRSASGSGGATSGAIAPDFSFLKDGIMSSLTFNLADILFRWSDLTAEDILAKIITLLTSIAGGVIGFTLGGVGGAVIGMLIGASLGLLISDLIFDGDRQLNQEEILRSIILALGMLAGGVIGFMIGGPGGAAIGLLIGAGAALAIGNLIFDGDGQLNQEEIIRAIVTVLSSLVGGIVGFMVGGPGGAAIGILIGGGIGLSISSILFNGDGQISQEEIISMMVLVLGALCGGVIGFVAGGPAGALIGVLVGAGASLSISSLIFDADGTISKTELINMIVNALVLIAGGAIGFVAGGPAGALIGIGIAAGINLLVKSVSFSDRTNGSRAGYEEGERIADNVEKGARDKLGTHSPSTKFKEIGSDVVAGLSDGIKASGPSAHQIFSDIMQGMVTSASTSTENIKTLFANLMSYLSTEYLPAFTVVGGLVSYNVADGISSNQELVLLAFSSTLDALLSLYLSWQTNFQNQLFMGLILYLQETFSTYWYQALIGLGNLLINACNMWLSVVEDFTNSAIRAFNELIDAANAASAAMGVHLNIQRIPTLALGRIPALAQGAVIPPNREFLAVLGDQKSGTNIETPLDTMVQAFKTALSDMGYGGDQLIENILELDGEIIYRNQKKVARRHGVSLIDGR